MQTLISCMQCQAETGMPDFSSLALAEIPESGIIEASCERGHRTATIIQEAKFEILSEMGVSALVKGSFRDAVSSFASSLERLYEFFIEASCRHRGVSPETFSATWKSMASQSERQLGAFLVAFLLDTGEPARALPQKQVELRNAVIHKGRFADRDEAMRFGQAVFDCALPVLAILRSERYATTLRDMTSETIGGRYRRAREAGLHPSTMCMPTPLGFAAADQPTDLAAMVASYAARPDFGQVVEGSRALGASLRDPGS